MYKLLIIPGFVLVAATQFACRSTKKIQTVITQKDSVFVGNPKPAIDTAIKVDSAALKNAVLERVKKNHIDFNTFAAKIKVDYQEADGKNNNATAYVRIQKDSVIWVRLTGLLDIEGFRALITKDSIRVMDKLKNTITIRRIDYLQEVTKLPFDFYTLQDLLVGNPIYFADNIVSYRTNGNTILATSVGEIFKHLITIDTTNNTVLHSKLDDVKTDMNRTCDITFSDYSNKSGKLFPNKRAITVTEKAKLDIQLDYKQVNFDEPQTFPFNVPKSYKNK